MSLDLEKGQLGRCYSSTFLVRGPGYPECLGVNGQAYILATYV